jgi:hypothetical protein
MSTDGKISPAIVVPVRQKLSQEAIDGIRAEHREERRIFLDGIKKAKRRKHEELQELIFKIEDDRDLNLRFVHGRVQIQEWNSVPQSAAKGGATIAYAHLSRKSNVIWYSTAWCNPKDSYSRLEGALRAAAEFEEGKFTTFINRKNCTMDCALHSLLREII